MGSAAAFSFYPGKNLGACGEGRRRHDQRSRSCEKMRMLRDHGQAKKYYHDIEGYNGRLDAIQAGILSVKLNRLADWNERRRECAQRYQDLFADAGVKELAVYEPEWAKSVYHLYVIRVGHRETLMKYLADENIGTAIHYPVPLHLQKAYGYLGYRKGDFPAAEAVAPEIMSLPMFPQLSAKQQKSVVEEIEAFSGEVESVTPMKARYMVGD